ncbi:MAG: amino acid ABC transporter ATP-binding protein, partial [Clostridia bacterium]|nr:amino acid ABC transporter ATP-binding protein [Clostridia bacterium]
MIEIRHILKKYGDQVVLDDFSLSIGEGELVVLMGPSGCGKTTLCRLLLGLEKPDAGEIAGRPERVSAAFQAPVVCGHLSAIDNLRLVLPRLSREEALS